MSCIPVAAIPDKVNLLIDEVGWDGALQVILNILNQENDSKSR